MLVVSCHPCAESLVAAATDRALDALAATPAEVRHTDLYAIGFEPELTTEEHRHHVEPGVPPGLERHAGDLRWCDTLVLVHPTWWSGQPAMLKGWFDRVWAAGVAWELPPGADRLRPRLRNVRRIVVITTHGSSRLINAVQGPTGRRTAFRWMRAMCHPLARCTWIAVYGLDTCPPARISAFLDRVERRVAALAG